LKDTYVTNARVLLFGATVYRLANIIRSRNRHGVVWDFVQKLRDDPREPEILGNGTQNKSYPHVRNRVIARI